MMKDIEIKLIPYLADSKKNLIEYFAIIGNNEKNLLDFTFNTSDDEYNLELSIISEVKSDSINISYNEYIGYIIKQIYPDNPKIILISNSILKPNTSSIVFYHSFDSIDGKKKITRAFFALKFYEKFIDYISKKEYYIPKAFLIISQYPYFTLYYKICSFLLNYNKEENEIPFEILIYYFVNNIPNPMTNKLIFDNFSSHIIPKLSGYPYIDFNMFKIFDLVPINDLIKIFILIFLEIDLLIFSPNHEKLNIFMMIFYFLNYPLTDTNYLWHIKTISLKHIKEGNNALNTTFRGVNAKFKDYYDFSEFQYLNFIIDLENKKDLIINIQDNNESKEINNLLVYIDNILNNKNNKSYLSEIIFSLNNNLKNIKEYASSILVNTPDSFFYINNDIIKINERIQIIFYEFILKLTAIFYKDFQYDINTKSIKKRNNINEKKEFSKEELLFIKYYKNTIKYNVYFELFIREFSIIEEIIISFLFFDEFINLIIKDINNKHILNNLNYFQIIDKLYSLNPESNIIINFNELIEEYKSIKDKNIFEKFHNKTINQLISLDDNVINELLLYKNTIFKSFKNFENVKINQIERISISTLIEGFCYKNLDKKYFISSALIYCFSIFFPFFSFQNVKYFLFEILKEIKEMKYLQRYYLYILLKSIDKYYSLNNYINKFPDLNYYNINIYYGIIISFIIDNEIFPNQEIIEFFNQNIINNIVNDMKLSNETYKIDNKMISKNEIILNLKIKEKEIKSILLEPFEIYKHIKNIYSYYNFNTKNLKSEDIIEIIINIIHFFINDKNSQNKIIQFLLDLIQIIIGIFKIDIDKYNKKILEKYKFSN